MSSLSAAAHAASHSESMQRIESEISSLWDLPWDKPLPEPDFPEPIDNYPDHQRSDQLKAFDHNCVGCIAAGWVFCMDDSNSNHTAQEFGSCQPDWNHCTNAGNSPFETKLNFTECDYQGVKDPVTGVAYPSSDKILEIEING